MSVQVMAWVFEQDHRELRPSETLVLLSLANHASSDGGYAYPSVGTMAKETNLVRRSVQQALRSLVEKKIISEQRAATAKLGAMYQFESFRTGRNLEHPDIDHVGAHKMRRGGANPAPKPSDEPSGVLETPNVVSNTTVRERSDSRISLFAAFWESYPRAGRNSKSRTADAFSRLRGDELPLVMSGLNRWIDSERWQRGIVVDAAKWLKERRWEVDPGAAASNGSPTTSQGPVVEKVISRWATAAQELSGQQQSSENVVDATWRSSP